MAGVYSDASDIARLYINGELVVEDTSFDTVVDNSGNDFDLSIGSWYSENGHYWDGEIDDVRIYNRLLFTSEIQGLFNLVK